MDGMGEENGETNSLVLLEHGRDAWWGSMVRHGRLLSGIDVVSGVDLEGESDECVCRSSSRGRADRLREDGTLETRG